MKQYSSENCGTTLSFPALVIAYNPSGLTEIAKDVRSSMPTISLVMTIWYLGQTCSAAVFVQDYSSERLVPIVCSEGSSGRHADWTSDPLWHDWTPFNPQVPSLLLESPSFLSEMLLFLSRLSDHFRFQRRGACILCLLRALWNSRLLILNSVCYPLVEKNNQSDAKRGGHKNTTAVFIILYTIWAVKPFPYTLIPIKSVLKSYTLIPIKSVQNSYTLVPIKSVHKINTLIPIKSVHKINTLIPIKREASRGLNFFCDCCTPLAKQ